MVQIKLPDGSVKDYPDAVSPREVAQGIGKRLADAAVAAVAGGTVVDLDRPLENGNGQPIELRILTPRDREASMCCGIRPRTSWRGRSCGCFPAFGSRSARPRPAAIITTSSCPAGASPRKTSPPSRPRWPKF